MVKAINEQRIAWQEQGFVIIRDVIPREIIQSVKTAIQQIVDRALANEFTDPPFRWLDEERHIPYWMNDLLIPLKYYPAFGEFLDSVTLPFVESLLDAPARCSWLSMMTCGSGIPYSTPIHRDNNSCGTDEEAELIERYNGLQCYIQAPLLENDHFLQLIPRSHLRVATDYEIKASEVGWEGDTISGLETIEMNPGDIVFRQTNTLHRGWNPSGLMRSVMIAGFWRADAPLIDIELQDHKELNNPEFVSSLTPHTAKAVTRYLEAYELKQEAGSGNKIT